MGLISPSRHYCQDSVGLKLPRHYFNTVIALDSYRKPEKNLDTANAISRRLQTYGIRQFYLSFYTPLATTTDEDPHTHVISNSHLLLTGNYIVLRPEFAGISDHRLVKTGLGLRYIYNTGKKGVWFFDASPFITRDASSRSRPYFRLAATAIYSHNVSARFNWRLGITKSFMWGNRYYLPFIGLRIGRLDKVNLSIQLPRSIQLSIPVNMWIISLYVRPQGGMYNFANNDSLYFRKQVSTFHFTRYEVNTGLRIDGLITSYFNFYAALGLSTKNNITFYSETANPSKRKVPYHTYFYSRKADPGLFFNLGLVFRLGKTRTYLNDLNVYDAMDLNNANDGNRNANIPITPRKQSVLNLKGIEDLVDYNDL
jgi:hypothetical protein